MIAISPLPPGAVDIGRRGLDGKDGLRIDRPMVQRDKFFEARAAAAQVTGLPPATFGIEVDHQFVLVNWPTSMLSSEMRARVKDAVLRALPAGYEDYSVSIT